MDIWSWRGCVLGLGLWLSSVVLADDVAQRSCIQRDEAGDFLAWADYPHCLIDNRAQQSVRWLDDWFSDPSSDAVAKAYVRALTEVDIDDQGDLQNVLRFRARLHLPQWKNRLSLLLEDERPQELSEPVFNRANEASLALRYALSSLTRLRLEADAGVRSGPDPFVRVRYRQRWSLAEDTAFSLAQTVRYGLEEQLRLINELDVSQALSAHHVVSVFHTLDRQDGTASGWLWGRGALLSVTFSNQTSAAFVLGEEGVQQPQWETQNRFALIRWRQSWGRPWLFVELEPRLTQAVALEARWRPAFRLRLEVQFGYH